ncbi:MAG: SagB/ThcOx family dehydrogenase [Bacteroidales bacterium]|jgi:SagB-type dehydrogenase family enzyme|nr:SagB/ThcOx family dehydrogenase [Bacteroidales bacterium]
MACNIKIILLFSLSFMTCNVYTQNPIQLPEPQKQGGIPLMDALSKRSTTREFNAEKELSKQELSNILWSAFGYNRDEKRTAPSALNMQEIILFVFIQEGIYRWDAEQNILYPISKGDKRELAGKQDFVKDAALNIVYVADFTKMEEHYTKDTDKMNMAHVDCGFIGQNVYLYAASESMNCVFRGYIDKEQLHTTLKLNKNQHVLFSQSIGY